MECNICYNKSHNIVHCFSKCKIEVCRPCFRKMIRLDNEEICYTCPMCRDDNTYGKSQRFTKFMDKGLDLLKIVVVLYQGNIQRQTNDGWGRFINGDVYHDPEAYAMFDAWTHDVNLIDATREQRLAWRADDEIRASVMSLIITEPGA
jgi:hypothetical protein